jgi:farnesyl diphosphate synthase
MPPKRGSKRSANSAAANGKSAKRSKDEIKALFERVFEKLVNEIVAELPTTFEMPKPAVEWVREMVNVTVAGGKMNRAIFVYQCAATMAGEKGLTAKEEEEAAMIGWCIEWLQAFFLVEDDVMDGSKLRRGKPCWYLNPKVQLIAINDGFILQSHIYRILKKHFSHKTDQYLPLIELFNEVTYQTELGQLLDLTSQDQDAPMDLDKFTEERYKGIVKYKTAFYSFYLPLASGMILSGVDASNTKIFDTVRDICVQIGEYFQIQDDYLDCYADPEVLGKIGTDIQEAKCGWLVVQALKKVTPAQRKILAEHYGQDDEAGVAKVKALYAKLELEAEYKSYEEEAYKSINGSIAKIKGVPTEIFSDVLAKIYKRDK